MSDDTAGYFMLASKETDSTSGKSSTSSFTLGKTVVNLSANTIPNENNEYISSRISLQSGQNNLSIEVETENNGFTQGIYVNSETAPSNAGISFIDSTVDPEHPATRYFLKDFALKSDIPAGLDLTNYHGSISATNKFSDSNIVGTSTLKLNEAFSYTSQFTQPSFNNTVMKSTFSSTCMDMGCAIYIPRNDNNGVYYSVDTSTDLSGHYQIHTQYSSNGGATSINDPGNTGKYNLLIGGDNHFGLQFSYTNMSNETTPKLLVVPADGFYISGARCAIGEADIIQQDSISSSDGIWFKDTTIQSDAFTLKSLVDRIAQLETTVAQLQSQLAAKANTINPSFTGKVSITSE